MTLNNEWRNGSVTRFDNSPGVAIVRVWESPRSVHILRNQVISQVNYATYRECYRVRYCLNYCMKGYVDLTRGVKSHQQLGVILISCFI